MNVENYSRPVGGPPVVGQATVGGQAPSGDRPQADRPLTVRAAAQDPAAEAARRLEPVCDAAATSCDKLDALIKSVLDFAPPPLPNFDIMSENSL